MIIKSSELACVGAKLSQYPSDNKPEIAFVGKSNVGKSSLINALLGRKALARISSKPGKTRTINFYNVNDDFYIVDLPGYGYARASKEEISRWSKMIEEYLYNRTELMAIVMLIDIRHKPGENDIMMYNWLKHYGYNILIIATKADKIKRSQLNKQLNLIKNSLGLTCNPIPFSTVTKSGVEETLENLETVLGRGQTD